MSSSPRRWGTQLSCNEFWGLRCPHWAEMLGTMLLNDDLDAAIGRLMAQYNDRMAAGSILRCFARSVHELRAAGVDAGLAIAAEAMAQRRLDGRLSLSADVA